MATRAFATMSMLACLACASASPSARSLNSGYAEALAGCPNLTFVTSNQGNPEYTYLVEAGLVRDIEGSFADELEEWGWRRVDEASSAAFVLTVAVGPSFHRTDMVQGVVLLRSGNTTHRDFPFASMDGVFPLAGMEQESLAKLCARLVEDLRAELVREMVEIRKRARQPKELEIRLGEAQ